MNSEKGFPLSNVCVKATYLLTTVKEVETSVQGKEYHLLLK